MTYPRRRTVKRNTGFPPAVRAAVSVRSGGWCERCGAAHAVEIHHRRPRGMGGSKAPDTNRVTNALALCGSCHRWIEREHNRTESRVMGWLVLQGHDPAMTPLLYRGKWVFLTDDGGVEPAGFGDGVA
jgi:hypothetical protein